MTSHIFDIKDPNLLITFLHDLFIRHLLKNEDRWGADRDFFNNLKSAADGKYLKTSTSEGVDHLKTNDWDTRTKVLVFGGIPLRGSNHDYCYHLCW